MEFKQLQSFTAVVKYNSFTIAAEKLFISQPTISAHIRQLEDELNIRLISRTTKNIEITPKGREFYEYAVNILDLRDRMIEQCSSNTKKIIHLGASTIPSAYILPEILPEFGRHYPDTYFIIHQNDSHGIIESLLDGVFNVGLIGMPCKKESLTCIPFCQDHMIIITPVNEYFLKLQESAENPFQELLKSPIILREKGSGSKKSIDMFLEKMGIQEKDLHVTARINDQEAIKNLVAGGLGISIISERAARNFIKEKRLLCFELPEYIKHRNLYLAYRSDFIMKSHVQDFVNFIQKHYQT